MNPYIIDLIVGCFMSMIGFMVIFAKIWGNINNLWINF